MMITASAWAYQPGRSGRQRCYGAQGELNQAGASAGPCIVVTARIQRGANSTLMFGLVVRKTRILRVAGNGVRLNSALSGFRRSGALVVVAEITTFPSGPGWIPF